jgi:hypothetical protein
MYSRVWLLKGCTVDAASGRLVPSSWTSQHASDVTLIKSCQLIMQKQTSI